MYADDLVLICKRRNLRNIVKKIIKITKSYGLKLNSKKSAIFLMRKRKYDIESVEGIPVVGEYKYLGITMDNFGNIKR